MKVYVWEKVLGNYGEGMMIAIAASVEEARNTLLVTCPHIPEEYITLFPEEFDLTEPIAFFCKGE